MNVLHVFKSYYPPTHGGVEQHIHDLVHRIDGISFAVLTSSAGTNGASPFDGGVPVFRERELVRISSAPIVPAWRRRIRTLAPDLVHFHVPNPDAELAYLLGRPRPPMVCTFHADVVGRRGLSKLYRPLQRRFLAEASRIVVGSERLLETSPALAPHRERAVVIPFGTDAVSWALRPPRADELAARLARPVVLFLGRLVHYKGLDILVEAMRGVEATLVLVGDGPERGRVEAHARSAGVRAVFAGTVANGERAAWCHAADLFVLPSTSRAESFGIAMLDAMACGLPVVSTEVGTGTSWVNRDGETGLVVPPHDAAALRNAIERILRDDGLRRRMGEAAARRARADFSREAMLDAVASLYRSLAQTSG